MQDYQRQLENLTMKHQQDRLDIDEAHTREYQQFQNEWDTKITEKEQENMILVNQLEQKHARELEDNRISLEQKLTTAFKCSPELLNMKLKIDLYAK